jgi:TonB-linked SusC/RagA family outer membrane protein
MRNLINRLGVLAAMLTACATLAIPATLNAQGSGTVSGTITEQSSGRPLGDVRVHVAGTVLQGVSDLRGLYRINNVPTGSITLQVRRIGFRALEKIFALAADQQLVADFALNASVVTLEEVVVSGTAGDQKRRAQGAQVSEISVSDLARSAPVSTFEQILQSRVPGVSVTLASGTSGAFSQIRIRGPASISLSNEPIIYVDGIRMTAGTGNTFGLGGQTTGRMSEFNPRDIESIEVVKGPAAATLYGADASAGVIQIITKKGKSGSRFSQTLALEYNSLDAAFTPPSNFANCTTASVAPTSTNPLCRGKTVGDLVSDNPLVRDSAFRTGSTKGVQWSGTGGGSNFGYYLSADYATEDGTTPNNGFDRRSGRVNFNWAPSSRLTLTAGAAMTRANFILPDNDNNVYGYLGGGLLGTPLTRHDLGAAVSNDGWFGFARDVAAIQAIDNQQQTHRTIANATAVWTPRSWFTNRLTVGADWLRDEAHRFFPKNALGSYQGLSNTGDISENRQGTERYTLDYLGDITVGAGNKLTQHFSAGFQMLDLRDENIFATGQGLTVNSNNTVTAASSKSAGQGFVQTRSIGFLGQWQAAWNDRLYLTAGARIDANSAFGNTKEWFFLPKLGLSYVISEESWWKDGGGFLNTFRLRGAWGQTGRQPPQGAALVTLSPAPFIDAGTSQAGAIPNNAGNDSLKAERGVEYELGFDAGMFNDRVGVELTYYRKTSKNLLLAKPLPPSLGFLSNPFVNIGKLRNQGLEIGVTAQPIQQKNVSWDLRLGLSTLKSRIEDLGGIPAFGTLNRFQEGSEPGVFVGNRIRSIDTLTNIVVVSDSLEPIGPIFPTFEGNFSTNVTILRNLRLYASLDWKKGHYIQNNTDFFRETQLVRSDNRLDPLKLSKTERLRRYGNQTAGQPAFVREGKAPGCPGTACRFPTTATVNEVRDAYIEKADFLKLREVSLSYSLPSRWAGYVRAQNATLTLAGQNLHTWTGYLGFDPEVLSASAANYSRSDFLTLPPVRRFVFRANLTF